MIALLLLACMAGKDTATATYTCTSYAADCSDLRVCWLSPEDSYMADAWATLPQDNGDLSTEATRSKYTDAEGLHLCALCPGGYATLDVLICTPD